MVWKDTQLHILLFRCIFPLFNFWIVCLTWWAGRTSRFIAVFPLLAVVVSILHFQREMPKSPALKFTAGQKVLVVPVLPLADARPAGCYGRLAMARKCLPIRKTHSASPSGQNSCKNYNCAVKMADNFIIAPAGNVHVNNHRPPMGETKERRQPLSVQSYTQGKMRHSQA